jgi:ATP-dependent helicase HrpB
LRASERLARIAERAPSLELASGAAGEEALLRAVLAGFPDRVALRRGEDVQLAEGGAAVLARASVVKDAELLVAVHMDGRGAGRRATVRLASRVERDWLEAEGGGLVTETTGRFDPKKERVEVVRVVRFGELELEARPEPEARIDPSAALVEAARAHLDRALPVTDELQAFFHRYAFARRALPELELRELGPDARLEILEPVALGKRSFAELRREDLRPHLLSLAGAPDLDAHAPTHVRIPSGRRARLRYQAEGPPVLSVRLQEVFGLQESPKVAGGRVPVKMELLAPNHRPVQVTQDLASFWARTYAEVRKELRRRYPKHQWPEDPKQGVASARVRPRRG